MTTDGQDNPANAEAMQATVNTANAVAQIRTEPTCIVEGCAQPRLHDFVRVSADGHRIIHLDDPDPTVLRDAIAQLQGRAGRVSDRQPSPLPEDVRPLPGAGEAQDGVDRDLTGWFTAARTAVADVERLTRERDEARVEVSILQTTLREVLSKGEALAAKLARVEAALVEVEAVADRRDPTGAPHDTDVATARAIGRVNGIDWVVSRVRTAGSEPWDVGDNPSDACKDRDHIDCDGTTHAPEGEWGWDACPCTCHPRNAPDSTEAGR